MCSTDLHLVPGCQLTCGPSHLQSLPVPAVSSGLHNSSITLCLIPELQLKESQMSEPEFRHQLVYLPFDAAEETEAGGNDRSKD